MNTQNNSACAFESDGSDMMEYMILIEPGWTAVPSSSKTLNFNFLDLAGLGRDMLKEVWGLDLLTKLERIIILGKK